MIAFIKLKGRTRYEQRICCLGFNDSGQDAADTITWVTKSSMSWLKAVAI